MAEDQHRSENPLDDTCLENVFLRHKQALKTWVMRFLKRPQDVEDIVQEAFLRAYQVQLKKPINNPAAYLFQTAKNLSFKSNDRSEQKLTDYIVDFDLPAVNTDIDSVIQTLEAHEQFSYFCQAVRELPLQCRRVFILKKVYDLSHEEIAERLGISVSTSHQHLAKGLARCTAYMKTHGLLNVPESSVNSSKRTNQR